MGVQRSLDIVPHVPVAKSAQAVSRLIADGRMFFSRAEAAKRAKIRAHRTSVAETTYLDSPFPRRIPQPNGFPLTEHAQNTFPCIPFLDYYKCSKIGVIITVLIELFPHAGIERLEAIFVWERLETFDLHLLQLLLRWLSVRRNIPTDDVQQFLNEKFVSGLRTGRTFPHVLLGPGQVEGRHGGCRHEDGRKNR